MTSYLSPATIKAAVDNLGKSRAQSSLLDFLIFKRALLITTDGEAPATVTTGTKSPPYVAAVDELSGVAAAADSELSYFLPFGARRDPVRGYRSKKYPSNGPSDTASRWQSRPAHPVELIPDTKPKEFAPVARTADELEAFLLVTERAPDAVGKPRLANAPAWKAGGASDGARGFESRRLRSHPRACSSIGRAPVLQTGGRRFDSGQVHSPVV